MHCLAADLVLAHCARINRALGCVNDLLSVLVVRASLEATEQKSFVFALMSQLHGCHAVILTLDVA